MRNSLNFQLGLQFGILLVTNTPCFPEDGTQKHEFDFLKHVSRVGPLMKSIPIVDYGNSISHYRNILH